MSEQQTHQVNVNGVVRDLPLMEVKPGLRIAILNILGDAELTMAAARGLAAKLDAGTYDVLVTAEAKSIPLIHALAVETGKPYAVLRKSYKPYMGDAISAETLSITTGKPQTLYLDAKDKALIEGRRVALLDDVVSTGSTQQAMRAVVEKAGATITIEAAILTEGMPGDWADIVALGHLPLFFDEK